jgi:hypothetical protein
VNGLYLDVKRNIALADQYWRDEVNGSNAFMQRFQCLIF